MIASIAILILSLGPQEGMTTVQRIQSFVERGDFQTAQVLVRDEFAKSQETGSQQALYQMALTWMREYRFDAAVWMFEMFLLNSPNTFSAHSDYALALRRSGRYDEAEKAYKRTVEKFPREGTILNDYGLFLQAQGRDEEAEKSFRESYRLGNLDSVDNLAVLKRLRADRSKGRDYLNESLATDSPDHPRRWSRALFGFARLDREHL